MRFSPLSFFSVFVDFSFTKAELSQVCPEAKTTKLERERERDEEEEEEERRRDRGKEEKESASLTELLAKRAKKGAGKYRIQLTKQWGIKYKY